MKKLFLFIIQEVQSFQLDEAITENDMEFSDDDDDYGSCSSKRLKLDKCKKKVQNISYNN